MTRLKVKDQSKLYHVILIIINYDYVMLGVAVFIPDKIDFRAMALSRRKMDIS